MPTVMRIGRLRVVIYPNDHRPAHVHVIGGGCEAVFVLNCPEGPPELRQNYAFSQPELNRVCALLATELITACEKWRYIHGHYL
jgi:hypothetical protein